MEVLHRIADEFEKRKDDLLVFALLLGFGFFINLSLIHISLI